jgi:hypothetical protein
MGDVDAGEGIVSQQLDFPAVGTGFQSSAQAQAWDWAAMPAGVDQDDANAGLTSHAGQARLSSMIIRGFQAFHSRKGRRLALI